MTTLMKLGLGVVCVYALIVIALFAFQRRILFVPNPQRVQPADVGLDAAETVAVETADGLRLEGWWLAPREGYPVLLYLQGNGGSIAGRADKALRMHGRGYGVLLAGYRGYGGNPGQPSETGLIADGDAWLAHLRGRGVSDRRVVLYGESLGTGVATALAAREPVGAVVLEAPFVSIREIAERRYWFVPVRWLLRDPFDSEARIGGLKAPLLVVHGSNDTLIPVADGRRLYDAAPDPKRMVVVDGGGHTDLVESGALDSVDEFLADHEILTPER